MNPDSRQQGGIENNWNCVEKNSKVTRKLIETFARQPHTLHRKGKPTNYNKLSCAQWRFKQK